MEVLLCIECGIKIKDNLQPLICPACGSDKFKVTQSKNKLSTATKNTDARKGKKIPLTKNVSMDVTTPPIPHSYDEYICRHCEKRFSGDETTTQCIYCFSNVIDLYLPIYESKMFYLRLFEGLELFFLKILKPHILLAEYLILFFTLYSYVSSIAEFKPQALILNILLYSLLGTFTFKLSLFTILKSIKVFIEIFINPSRLIKHLPFYSIVNRRLRLLPKVLKEIFHNTMPDKYIYYSLLIIKDEARIGKSRHRMERKVIKKLSVGRIIMGKINQDISSKKKTIFYEVETGSEKGYIHKDAVLKLDDFKNYLGLRLVINNQKDDAIVYEKPLSDSKKVTRIKRGAWFVEFCSISNGQYYMKKRGDQIWGAMADENWIKIYKNIYLSS